MCLYFIQPTGHGLKPIDIEFMRRLHDKVNIIPLIAKADTLTPQEQEDFKLQILGCPLGKLSKTYNRWIFKTSENFSSG